MNQITKLDLALQMDRFWAIEPGRAQILAAQLAEIGAEEDRSQPELSARKNTGKGKASEFMTVTEDGTAIIYLTGVMTKRPAGSAGPRGTATIFTRAQLRAAAADPEVKRALMVVDSPGGQIDGLRALAADALALRAKKPFVAFIDDFGASAALWPASMADYIFAGPGSLIGSIGVVAAIADRSAEAAMAGIKVHLITTGAYKGAGTPGTVIEKHHIEQWQAQVNATYEDFIAAIAGGRELSVNHVRNLADGRMYTAVDALANGLIDGIGSIDDCINTISAEGFSGRELAASTAKITGDGTMKTQNPSAWETVKSLFAGAGLIKNDAAAGEATAETAIDKANGHITHLEAENGALTESLAAVVAENASLKDQVKELAAGQASTEADASALDKMAGMLVEAYGPALTPAQRAAIKPLAYVALAGDGGEPGERCATLKTLMSGLETRDMKKGELLVVAQPNTSKAQEKEAESVKVLAGAVSAYNKRGGQ